MEESEFNHIKEDLDLMVESVRKNSNMVTFLEVVYSANSLIKALEREMPKEPSFDDKKDIYLCPECEEFVGCNAFDGRYMKTYCENCGKRIDWEDA